jgi:ABC-2 type transport system ATP-binding protein
VLDLDTATEGARIRELVGYMPEHDCLPPDVSATEFVSHMARVSGLPSGAARERTADVLRHVGLYEERYRPIGGYSTGMKQRVKLAQSLVHDPRVLFLDEPTNGLDPAGRDEMLALIERIGREFGIAVIVASHLLGEIERVAGWLVAIDAGRLLRTASLSSFTERTGQLLIETDEDAAGLAERLVARGIDARADGRTVLADLSTGGGGEFAVYDAVRDEAVALRLALIRIEARRHQLEDLFRTGGADDRVG